MNDLEEKRWTRAEERLRYIASDDSSHFIFESYGELIDEISFLNTTVGQDLSVVDFQGVTKNILKKIRKIACISQCA